MYNLLGMWCQDKGDRKKAESKLNKGVGFLCDPMGACGVEIEPELVLSERKEVGCLYSCDSDWPGSAHLGWGEQCAAS